MNNTISSQQATATNRCLESPTVNIGKLGFILSLIMKSCFVENEGGRHWYLAAISPDGKTEIKLSEPTLDMPED